MKNKLIAFTALAALITSMALADTSQEKSDTKPIPSNTPVTVPVTLTPQDLMQLEQFLNNQPYSLAAPIIGFLQQKEQEAQQATKK